MNVVIEFFTIRSYILDEDEMNSKQLIYRENETCRFLIVNKDLINEINSSLLLES